MIVVAVDAILVLVVLEGAGLAVLHRLSGRGPSPRRIVGLLAAGFFLLLALRAALGAAGDALIAACLLASLVAHLADLALRWRDAG